MTRKQSLKSELLEEIRQRKKGIEKWRLKLTDLEQLNVDLQKVIDRGVFSATRGRRFFQSKADSTQSRINGLKRRIANAESAIANLSIRAERAAAEATVKSAAARSGSLTTTPGWRWITGFVGRYVWDERGRVASIRRGLGDSVVLHLIQPVRRGLYQLPVEGGETITRSFSGIVQDGIEGSIFFSHVDNRPLSARRVSDGELMIIEPSGSGR